MFVDFQWFHWSWPYITFILGVNRKESVYFFVCFYFRLCFCKSKRNGSKIPWEKDYQERKKMAHWYPIISQIYPDILWYPMISPDIQLIPKHPLISPWYPQVSHDIPNTAWKWDVTPIVGRDLVSESKNAVSLQTEQLQWKYLSVTFCLWRVVWVWVWYPSDIPDIP